MPLIGHDRQLAYLNSCRTRGTLPHAYLFHGPEHVGKLSVALTLAQSFFCLEAQKNDIRSVCGTCSSCRAIAEFRHRSVFFLDTTHTLVSKKETRKEIPIEDIRELKRILSFAPQGDQWRLAIINEADKMSEEAANAFLKLLEEPGSNTLIILVSPHKDFLLPTIVSRVQAISFFTVPDKDIKIMLVKNGIEPEMQEEFLALAGGRPGVLIRLLGNPAFASEQKKLFNTIQVAVRNRDMVSLLRVSEQISQDPVLRDQGISCVIGDFRKELMNASSNSSFDEIDKIAKKIKQIDHIAELIDSTNVNPRLAMDVMFLECLRDC